MTHTHAFDHPTTAESSVRQLRALRLLIVVLIPIAIWTVVGLIVLWPHHTDAHIREDTSTYSAAGVTLPKGEITAVEPMSCQGQAGSTAGQTGEDCATITVRLTEGPDKGQEVQVTLTGAQYDSGVKPGQTVKLFRIPPPQGSQAQASYQFSDFDRTVPLLALVGAFALVVIVVARWRGFASLIGLGFAGFILIQFMFPALVGGQNPILVGLIGSSAIMFVVLYTAHGFSARTTTALVGTLFGLALTAALGWGVTRWAHLTGVAAEDDYLLSASAPDMSLTAVVLCGIIIAGLGVLNDVTITQASAVWELAESDPDQKKLFSQAMRIGRDHIASSVYTIAFATAGAGLSTLLLITVYGRGLAEVAQTEALSEEIIRTLVGAIGLVLAMPLTTVIGVAVVRVGKQRHRDRDGSERGTPTHATPVGIVELPATSQRVRPSTPPPAMDERETTRLPRVERVELEQEQAKRAAQQPAGSARADRLRTGVGSKSSGAGEAESSGTRSSGGSGEAESSGTRSSGDSDEAGSSGTGSSEAGSSGTGSSEAGSSGTGSKSTGSGNAGSNEASSGGTGASDAGSAGAGRPNKRGADKRRAEKAVGTKGRADNGRTDTSGADTRFDTRPGDGDRSAAGDRAVSSVDAKGPGTEGINAGPDRANAAVGSAGSRSDGGTGSAGAEEKSADSGRTGTPGAIDRTDSSGDRPKGGGSRGSKGGGTSDDDPQGSGASGDDTRDGASSEGGSRVGGSRVGGSDQSTDSAVPDNPGGPQDDGTEASPAAPTDGHRTHRRRSRRARDDESFNFADLHDDDPTEPDDQPRGRRWR